MISLVAMVGDCLCSSAWATVLIPSRWGMLVYNAPTSIVTRIESLGTPFVLLSFLRKAPVSFIYDGSDSAIGCRW